MTIAIDGPGRVAHQGTFDELGTPLSQVTFCVVDLETTGGSARSGAAITEIGAVKVCSGVVQGEFQTLVNPGFAVPPFITVLTGITDQMLVPAPPVGAALAAFLEFARGCVLVAHNAPFDVGFLRAAAAEHAYAWPAFPVLDTVRLAQRVLTRDDTPNCKLATLARFFRSRVTPEHRALGDARATVDVLHGLLERLGPLGVQTWEELATYSSRVSAAQRRKRHLAEKLPHEPGVYLFTDDQGTVLYVGTSKDLRTRVRSYFTASETRSRMGEMVALAADVTGIPCATALEAQVRELRLIAAHKPRYNRRSRHPERTSWLKLTVEPFPRLSIVREVRPDQASYLGPFGSRHSAEDAMTALHDSFALRQCAQRLSRHPHGSACVLAELGRCLAPCTGAVSPPTYAAEADRVRAAIERDPRPVLAALDLRMRRLAAAERFEEAARHRDRLGCYLRAAARGQRLAMLARCAHLVAARRDDRGGWEVHVVRHGRLAGAGRVSPGTPPMPVIDQIVASSETVLAAPWPAPAATPEEADRVARWLEQPGVRLVDLAGEWSCPIAGAGGHLARLSPR